jgi:hypothetical protein
LSFRATICTLACEKREGHRGREQGLPGESHSNGSILNKVFNKNLSNAMHPAEIAMNSKCLALAYLHADFQIYRAKRLHHRLRMQATPHIINFIFSL